MKIKIYVDAAFFPDDKNAFAYYILEIYANEVQNIEEYLNLGYVSNSTMAEYKAVEFTLVKLEKYLEKNKISKKNVCIEILTDLQVLSRQFNQWIAPPSNTKIFKFYNRILEQMRGFEKSDLFWISRKENKAGVKIEKLLKEKKNNYTRIDTKVLTHDLDKSQIDKKSTVIKAKVKNDYKVVFSKEEIDVLIDLQKKLNYFLEKIIKTS